MRFVIGLLFLANLIMACPPAHATISERERQNILAMCLRALKGTSARAAFIDEYVERVLTTPYENGQWMELVAAPYDGRTLYLDVENAVLKRLNETMEDKAFVTALTHRFQEILMSELNRAIAENHLTDVAEIRPYADFKSVRYAFLLQPQQNKLPDDLKQILNSAFLRAVDLYNASLIDERLIRLEDAATAGHWFRGGIGATADQASIAARYARELGVNNWLTDFTDPSVHEKLDSQLQTFWDLHKKLQKTFQNSPLLDTSPSHAGQVLKQVVFEAYRKYREPTLLREVLQKRYGYDASDEQINLMISYIQKVDMFTPAIHVRSREDISLARSYYGGISIDFVGQGGVNLYQTALALTAAENLEGALQTVREREKPTTEEFKNRKRLVQLTVQHVITQAGNSGIFKTSGDDMVFRPNRKIREATLQQILAELSIATSPASLRLVYVVPKQGLRRGPRPSNDALVTLGETIEKRTRAELEGIIPRQRLDQLVLMVVMGEREPRLLHHSNVTLTEEERNALHAAFARANAKLRE